MSRWRRQRNRRWKQTQSNANLGEVNRGIAIWYAHGKLSSTLKPLERRMVVALVRRMWQERPQNVDWYLRCAQRWHTTRKDAKLKVLTAVFRGV